MCGLGGVHFNDFMEYLQPVSEIRHCGGTNRNIADPQSLMRQKRVDRNSVNSAGFSGTTHSRIPETPMFAKAQKSKTHKRIERISGR